MDRTVRRRWLAYLAALALIGLVAASALTRDDVIRMSKEGGSDEEIIEAIRASGATFDLTANDIADLRQAGVSEKVIDAMIETSPAPAEAELEETEESEAGESAEDYGDAGSVVVPGYPAYPSLWYPVYPLWYPAYVPIYHPFYPFFDGFFFSFSFVHVSRLHTVFPCDRTVIVVKDPLIVNRIGAHPRSLLLRRPAVHSVPRARAIERTAWRPGHPRGGSLAPAPPSRSVLRDPRDAGLRAGRPAPARVPGRRLLAASPRASRLAESRDSATPPGLSRRAGPRFSPPSAPHLTGARRPVPGAGPRYQAPAGLHAPHRARPRLSSPPRLAAPRRVAAPSLSTRGMAAPRGGASPRAAGRSPSSPRGGGRSHPRR